MVVLCRYGQGVEENKEHHHPVKALGFHIHQALHPEETIPATAQAAIYKNNLGLQWQAAVDIPYQHLHIYKTADSLIVDDSTLAFQVMQAVCVRVTTGQRQQSWRERITVWPQQYHCMGWVLSWFFSTDLFPLCQHPGLQREWSTPCSRGGLHPAADALAISETLHATLPFLSLWWTLWLERGRKVHQQMWLFFSLFVSRSKTRTAGIIKAVLPTEHTQNQIEHEEGTDQNEGNKVEPGPFVSYGIIYLKDKHCHLLRFWKEIPKFQRRRWLEHKFSQYWNWETSETMFKQSLTQ